MESRLALMRRRQTDRQIDRQTDRQANRQTDRQTEERRCVYCIVLYCIALCCMVLCVPSHPFPFLSSPSQAEGVKGSKLELSWVELFIFCRKESKGKEGKGRVIRFLYVKFNSNFTHSYQLQFLLHSIIFFKNSTGDLKTSVYLSVRLVKIQNFFWTWF
jgi:hypothetical protein